MTFSTRDVLIGVVALIVGLGLGFVFKNAPTSSIAFGGATTTASNFAEIHINPMLFTNGLGAGTSGQFQTDSNGNLTEIGTFLLGKSGTAQVNQITTTCAMKADNSITATSTGYAYCTGVTGVTSADNVLGLFSTSTAGFALNDSWEIVTAKASTTAGAIDFILYNNTGKTQAPSAVSRTASTTVIHASH